MWGGGAFDAIRGIRSGKARSFAVVYEDARKGWGCWDLAASTNDG